jgi:uncharacterized membrane protein YeiH
MNLILLIMYIGIFVFAGTGALKARTHHMDIFGGAVIAFATAYGGGTIRDLLIGAHPVNWVNDYLALGLVSECCDHRFLYSIPTRSVSGKQFFLQMP